MAAAPLDPALLDDPGATDTEHTGVSLRALATAAAQVREAAALAPAAVAALDGEPRPRAVVIAGMGASGLTGDLLAAVAGPRCPVPVVVHKGYGLPGWVGAADAVIAVSASGSSEETLTSVDEAARRASRLVCVGAAGSTLEERALHARGVFAPVTTGLSSRESLWALAVPVLLAAQHLGVAPAVSDDLAATADRLEQLSITCRPSSESFLNPAKTLALSLAGTLPVVWGTSEGSGVAAYRLVCQLAEAARLPALLGALPEATHHQALLLDQPQGSRASAGEHDDDDFFRDREDDEDGRLHLVLLRDPDDELPGTSKRADVVVEMARSRGVVVSELESAGGSRLERIASLVALTDYAAVYLGLLTGAAPTPAEVLDDARRRMSL